LLNGKIYFGKTYNIKVRFNGHKSAAKAKKPGDFSHLHRAMSKYGAEHFKIELVEWFETEAEAFENEIFLIANFNTRNHDIGYNGTDGGDGASGYKYSEEAKKQMSERRKGKYIGENNPFFGKKHTEETKQHLSVLKKQMYKDNQEKYDQLNILQCDLNRETCLQIQREYLQKDISMEKLTEKYNTNINTIHSIIHGVYAAIKGHSIITEDDFKQIKKDRQKTQALKYKKLNVEQEREIINNYLIFNIGVEELALKYSVSTPTIKKVFIENNIEIKTKPRQKI